MAHDLEKLKDWIGERETDVDYVTIPCVHRLRRHSIAMIRYRIRRCAAARLAHHATFRASCVNRRSVTTVIQRAAIFYRRCRCRAA